MNLNNYLPKLNFQTIEFLEKIITVDSLVFETGSGNSTIWFGKQVKKVVSLENKKGHYERVKGFIEKENLQNVKLYFDPSYFTKQFKDILEKEDLIQYDIVLHDGPFNAALRISAMKFIHTFVKDGGYLVIDDTHSPVVQDAISKYFDILTWRKTDIPYGLDSFGYGKSATIYRRSTNE